MSPIRSIWRGRLWSKIEFKVKVHQSFLSDYSCPFPYFLHASLEDCLSNENYSSSDNDKLNICFKKNCINDDYSSAYVHDDSYNTLSVEVHKDLLGSKSKFRVVVESKLCPDGNNNLCKDIIYGVSQDIFVTDLALSIEQHYMENPYSIIIDENMFAWYSKCGGENTGLHATIHLLGENGRVGNNFTSPIKLITELVYDNEMSTPIMPLCPLKERRSSKTSMKPLYRSLESVTEILVGRDSTSFTFRIEEVSFHHSGHVGFKLKVSAVGIHQYTVHPGFTKETIIVLSKPRSLQRKSGDFNEENLMKMELPSDFISSQPSTKRRRVTPLEEQPRKLMACFRRCTLVNSFLLNGKCLCCSQDISAGSFFQSSVHKAYCTFANNIIPIILPCIDTNRSSFDEYLSTSPTLFMTSTSMNISPLMTNNDSNPNQGLKIKEEPHEISFMHNDDVLGGLENSFKPSIIHSNGDTMEDYPVNPIISPISLAQSSFEPLDFKVEPDDRAITNELRRFASQKIFTFDDLEKTETTNVQTVKHEEPEVQCVEASGREELKIENVEVFHEGMFSV
eukprot:CAMPEP_0184874072 /NCGR_PEP_ID=MMETSP0580-20130426/42189_1 /TAXON_ID=1118495 /ORGANISM="Dactyliosolen fragilissimus" /LENGTH=563 /DNA_ID=CAMNT_0027377039 /DNA_START=819 /DNA_END=2510 /DNA_ORIENTATION=-